MATVQGVLQKRCAALSVGLAKGMGLARVRGPLVREPEPGMQAGLCTTAAFDLREAWNMENRFHHGQILRDASVAMSRLRKAGIVNSNGTRTSTAMDGGYWAGG